MRAVTIHDDREFRDTRILAFDLIDLLRLSTDRVARSSWTCQHAEFLGVGADEFHSAADSGPPISGMEFLRLAAGIDQTIDGDFSGYLPGNDRPWLVIRSIRGTEFVVITDNDDHMKAVHNHFRDVRDSPLDVEFVT